MADSFCDLDFREALLSTVALKDIMSMVINIVMHPSSIALAMHSQSMHLLTMPTRSPQRGPNNDVTLGWIEKGGFRGIFLRELRCLCLNSSA